MSGELQRHSAVRKATKIPNAGRWLLSLLIVLAAAAMWWLVYSNLERFANWLVYDALGMPADNRLVSAIAFFVSEAPKVLMLLLVVVFAVGIVRSFFTPERTRRMLAGQRQTAGNVRPASSPWCRRFSRKALRSGRCLHS